MKRQLCLVYISIGCCADGLLQQGLGSQQRVSDLQALHAERLFSQPVYDTIGEGKIAVIPDFLPQDEMIRLRQDAGNLYAQNMFSTDALASYGSDGKFDPSKDRAVLKLQQWKDQSIGDWSLRQRYGNRIRYLREDLAYNLNRPAMLLGDSVSKYGEGSTEISYTRFGPGAFLKRHVDEHHEELKGPAGWSKPTRRSLSWLIYLNEDWDADKHGGCLRCFERNSPPLALPGARGSGDLQIGWLKATSAEPYERPVFMDAQHSGTGANTGMCALYIDDPSSDMGRKYISKNFHAQPTLYVSGSELIVQSTLLNNRDLAQRFKLIETPKSAVIDFLQAKESQAAEERTNDVAPRGGTLVVSIDCTSLMSPHLHSLSSFSLGIIAGL